LTQEIELRLERSLNAEDHAGGPATAALVQAIIADIAEIEAITGKSWAEDNQTYSAVRRAVIGAIMDRPPPRLENHDEVVAKLEQFRLCQKIVDVAQQAVSSRSFLGFEGDALAKALQQFEKALPQALVGMKKATAALDHALEAQRQAERRGRKIQAELRKQRRESADVRGV
jgi:hypothetical protein